MVKKLIFLGVLFCAFGCSDPFSPDHPSLKGLLAAPEEIIIEGRSLALETYLWRNLMPGGEPGGGPLLALIRVTAVDLKPYPPAVDADRLWIVFQGAVWETDLPETLHETLHQLSKMARGGPKWGPDVYVDVVVRVVHAAGGRYLLRASRQLIGAAF